MANLSNTEIDLEIEQELHLLVEACETEEAVNPDSEVEQTQVLMSSLPEASDWKHLHVPPSFRQAFSVLNVHIGCG